MAADPLKPLDEFNRERAAVLRDRTPVPNGLACPKCGAELVDDNDGVILMCYPPRLHCSCLACGLRTSRVE